MIYIRLGFVSNCLLHNLDSILPDDIQPKERTVHVDLICKFIDAATLVVVSSPVELIIMAAINLANSSKSPSERKAIDIRLFAIDSVHVEPRRYRPSPNLKFIDYTHAEQKFVFIIRK